MTKDLEPYLKGETITEVVDQNIVLPSTLLDVKEALCHICGVTKVEDIGTAGPPLASIALGDDIKAIKSLRMYEAVFGRDSLYMSDHLLDQFPQIARTTLLYLASMQGLEFNQYREEEPGRIAHEIRLPGDAIGEALTKKKGWQWPYYGSIDSTLLFIRVVYRYSKETEEGERFLDVSYTDREGNFKTICDAVTRAVEWIEARINTNPEGFIESKASFPESLCIQSLQDSDTSDSLFTRDGTLANEKQGIIPVEVQGQAYDALVYAAELLKRPELLEKARKLKNEIMKFWISDATGNYFAAGADRDDNGIIRMMNIKKPMAGFLLNSEVFNEKTPEMKIMLDSFVETLLDKTMLAPGGLRSLASDEPYYTPVSYHNGSVWPVITYEVARGLRRQGYENEAKDLEKRILRCAEETHCYPEYVRGDDTDSIKINTRIIRSTNPAGRNRKIERPPQLYQGWTVSAIAAIVKAK